MRNWTGVHNDKPEVGDGLSMVRNVSWIINGLSRRRPALDTRWTLSATLLSFIDHPTAGGFLIANNGSGKLVGVKLSDNSSTDLSTGMSSDIRGCFVQHQQKVYFSNDFDSVVRMDRGDATAATAGIAAPTVAPSSSTSAGTIDAGIHRFRYRYKDTRTGYVSNPSVELVVTATGSLQYAITCTQSADSKVNQMILEATEAGGTRFFQVGVRANSTGTVAFAVLDSVLRAGIDSDSYYGAFGHEPPPIVELMCEHRGRLFGFKTSKRTRTGCTVSNGSPTISGTNFTANYAGRLVLVNNETTPYVISSSTTTDITLTANYGGSASGSANTIHILSPTPDMLYWSRAGYPESWKPSEWARRVLNNGDEPTALFSSYDTLWVAGLRTLKAFDYTADPAAARLQQIPTSMGIYNQRCVVNAEGRVFAFGPAGVFELKGRIPTPISAPIDQSLEALIDRTQYESFHGVYDIYEDTVTFWFCRSGDTTPKDGIAYHLASGQWQMRTWRQGIACSVELTTTVYAPRPVVGCSNGYCWRLTEGKLGDGIPDSLTTGVVTVTPGSTTTVINVSESMPTGSADLKGVMLYNPSTGEAKAISSNTANTITTAAFSSAPSAGTELYLGSIPVYLQSEWWFGPSVHARKNPEYLMIENQTTETGCRYAVQIKQDLGNTALTWTKGMGDAELLGITTTANSSTAYVDTVQGAGILYLNLFNKWGKYWRWELTQDRPAGYPNLMDVRFLIRSSQFIDAKVKPT